MPKMPAEMIRAHAEESARKREQAELAAANPRPLVVDEAAVKRRNEISAQLLAYYERLVTLYLPEEALKRPTEEGWPYVNAERFAFLDKTDAVIDFYKHLPYISQDHEAEYKIFSRAIAVDYTGKHFKNQHVWSQDGEMEPPQYYEQMEGEPTWPGRLEEPRHIAVLAQTSKSTDQYILLDTRDGKVAQVFPRDEEDSVSMDEYESIQELIKSMLEGFRKLWILPITPTDLLVARNTYLPDEDVTRIKEIFRKYGWFTEEYNKQACMREIGAVWDAFWQK